MRGDTTADSRAASPRLERAAETTADGKRERVIVFGAHPDDGEIGAGGLIAAYADRGHRIVMAIMRVPSGAEAGGPPERERRWAEANRAAEILGAELLIFGLDRDAIRPDARLVGAIDKLVADFRPTSVYTHWLGDSHPEHIGLTRAVLAATRHNQCSVYMYEATIPGGITEQSFRPQKFVGVSDTIERKMESLACHHTQLERFGSSWLEAIRGRAAHRGFQIRQRYAEAFEVVKEIAAIPDLRP
jgi:LmbE family N-acetylglucosaminyl deacetylase